MKINTIYLDLQEAEKKKKNGKDVRVLESEAFKDPLNLQVVFDEEEKHYFDQKIEEQKKILNTMEEVLEGMKKERESFEQYKLTVEQEINEKDKLIMKLQKEIMINNAEKHGIEQGIEMVKECITSTDLDVENLFKQMGEVKETLKRKPHLLKGSEFFSSSGESYLGNFEINEGTYLEIKQIKVNEKNEYCTNEDSLTINQIHVLNPYLPTYHLTSSTKLDTPTATVDYTLVLLPL